MRYLESFSKNQEIIKTLSKEEKEDIMDMFQEFADDVDIYHYEPFGGSSDNISNTYFIIESSFFAGEKSYSSINIYFQIYDETNFENIVSNLKLLINRINSYLNRKNCCIARSIDIKYARGSRASSMKKIDFFISNSEVIEAIRRGDFELNNLVSNNYEYYQ
jgi:hypothetical protein